MSANLDDHLRTVFFPFASGKIKQLVAHLPLMNDPLSGIDGIAPADLIKKIVIGPAEFPEATFDALARSLTKACGSNAADRISISGVPLRLS